MFQNKLRYGALIVSGLLAYSSLGFTIPTEIIPLSCPLGPEFCAAKTFQGGTALIMGPKDGCCSGKLPSGIAIGEVLSARVTGMTPNNSKGAKYQYQWFRNGKKITGATNSWYVIIDSDIGKQMSVEITATKKGYVAKTLKSARTIPVAGLAPGIPINAAQALKRSDYLVTRAGSVVPKQCWERTPDGSGWWIWPFPEHCDLPYFLSITAQRPGPSGAVMFEPDPDFVPPKNQAVPTKCASCE